MAKILISKTKLKEKKINWKERDLSENPDEDKYGKGSTVQKKETKKRDKKWKEKDDLTRSRV